MTAVTARGCTWMGTGTVPTVRWRSRSRPLDRGRDLAQEEFARRRTVPVGVMPGDDGARAIGGGVTDRIEPASPRERREMVLDVLGVTGVLHITEAVGGGPGVGLDQPDAVTERGGDRVAGVAGERGSEHPVHVASDVVRADVGLW